ncbi:negative elongation factor A [Biomphalaria pfeifferi]|uniref:Negative elongation factor A n=1 Tax=Biomphalaria pfeifferi TaxID=112525 RepID=A0AAD8F5Q0_BIOPF|nr:negative elongation factor A [Biomphalaria pfeifferi]
MAAGDTALWLHNKLGSTDDLWSGKSICSQLSQERLINIQDCFHALQSHVKVKLLLSFLHIPRRNVEQWQSDLEEIISLGTNDPDPWVATIGEIMREFPSTGALLLVEQDNRSDSNMLVCLDEIKLLAKNSTVSMMPLECQYLNKAALTAAAGHIPEASKHFTVKRKPKSAALRAEIIQKSSESVTNKRNHASSSVPIKSRSFAKAMDITPLKMTPTRSSLSGTDFRSPNSSLRLNSSLSRSPITPLPISARPGSAKKDTKIKLLEIEEMPVGAKEAKRRKKIADMAQEAQKKEAAAVAAANAGGVSPVVTSPTTPSTVASYTPDYAAGLLAPVTPKMPITVLSVAPSALSQPTPAYLPNSVRQNAPTTIGEIGTISSVLPITKQNLSQQLKQQLLQQPQGIRQTAPTPITMMSPILIAQQPSFTTTVITQSNTALFTTAASPATASLPTAIVRPQQTVLLQQGTKLGVQPQLVAVAPSIAPSQPQPAAKKGLSLTKEQMIEAQEMFKASNKVSRPEKALILGFMAGSRENPCPQQGSVLNIKLSEKEELVQMPDGTVKKKVEDIYFQMNYATGEWKRIHKLRDMAVS